MSRVFKHTIQDQEIIRELDQAAESARNAANPLNDTMLRSGAVFNGKNLLNYLKEVGESEDGYEKKIIEEDEAKLREEIIKWITQNLPSELKRSTDEDKRTAQKIADRFIASAPNQSYPDCFNQVFTTHGDTEKNTRITTKFLRNDCIITNTGNISYQGKFAIDVMIDDSVFSLEIPMDFTLEFKLNDNDKKLHLTSIQTSNDQLAAALKNKNNKQFFLNLIKTGVPYVKRTPDDDDASYAKKKNDVRLAQIKYLITFAEKNNLQLDLTGFDLNSQSELLTNLTANQLHGTKLDGAHAIIIALSGDRQRLRNAIYTLHADDIKSVFGGEKNFSGQDFSLLNFSNADLSNSNLSNSNFSGITLDNRTDFSDAITTGLIWDEKKEFTYDIYDTRDEDNQNPAQLASLTMTLEKFFAKFELLLGKNHPDLTDTLYKTVKSENGNDHKGERFLILHQYVRDNANTQNSEIRQVVETFKNTVYNLYVEQEEKKLLEVAQQTQTVAPAVPVAQPVGISTRRREYGDDDESSQNFSQQPTQAAQPTAAASIDQNQRRLDSLTRREKLLDFFQMPVDPQIVIARIKAREITSDAMRAENTENNFVPFTEQQIQKIDEICAKSITLPRMDNPSEGDLFLEFLKDLSRNNFSAGAKKLSFYDYLAQLQPPSSFNTIINSAPLSAAFQTEIDTAYAAYNTQENRVTALHDAIAQYVGKEGCKLRPLVYGWLQAAFPELQNKSSDEIKDLLLPWHSPWDQNIVNPIAQFVSSGNANFEKYYGTQGAQEMSNGVQPYFMRHVSNDKKDLNFIFDNGQLKIEIESAAFELKTTSVNRVLFGQPIQLGSCNLTIGRRDTDQCQIVRGESNNTELTALLTEKMDPKDYAPFIYKNAQRCILKRADDDLLKAKALLEICHKLELPLKSIRFDLTKRDFSKLNFTQADASAVNFKESDCSCSDFTGANLTGANLSGANLSGANLSGITIDNFTNFTNVKMRDVVDTAKPITYIVRDAKGDVASAMSIKPDALWKNYLEPALEKRGNNKTESFLYLMDDRKYTDAQKGMRALTVAQELEKTTPNDIGFRQAVYSALITARYDQWRVTQKSEEGVKTALQDLADFSRGLGTPLPVVEAPFDYSKLENLSGCTITGKEFARLAKELANTQPNKLNTFFQGVKIVGEISKIKLPDNKKIDLACADLREAKFVHFDTLKYISSLKNAKISADEQRKLFKVSGGGDQDAVSKLVRETGFSLLKLPAKIVSVLRKNENAVPKIQSSNYKEQLDKLEVDYNKVVFLDRRITSVLTGSESTAEIAKDSPIFLGCNNFTSDCVKDLAQRLGSGRQFALIKENSVTEDCDLIKALTEEKNKIDSSESDSAFSSKENLNQFITLCKWVQSKGGSAALVNLSVQDLDKLIKNAQVKKTFEFFGARPSGPLASVDGEYIKALILGVQELRRTKEENLQPAPQQPKSPRHE